MRIPVVVTSAVVVLGLVSCSEDRADETRVPEQSGGTEAQQAEEVATGAIPDSMRTLRFLEYLKSGEDPDAISRGFSVERGGHWEIEGLLAFIASDGLTIYDINGDVTQEYTRVELGQQLTDRDGQGFRQLVHLGHIYAQPYPQYSSLSFERSGPSIIVNVSDWYRLTFILEDGQLQVQKIEYLKLEGG